MIYRIDLGVSKFLERQEARLSIYFSIRSTEDQKPSNFEVSELLDRADEEDQNDTEFTRLSTKKCLSTNSLEISAKQLSEITAFVVDRCRLSVRQQHLFQFTIVCKR